MANIAHFIDTNVLGGAEALVEILAKDAADRGDCPILLHFDHDALELRIKRLGIRSIRLGKHHSYKKPKQILTFARYLRTLLRRERIDVLHSHLFGPTVAGAVATAGSHVVHVGTLHDSYILEEKPSRIRLLRVASALGTRIVAVSHSIKNYVVSRSAGTRVHVILNGTPARVEYPPAILEQFRQSLTLKANEVICVCVARLAAVKNHDLLLRCWQQIAEPKPRLLIVGDGPLLEETRAAADKTGVSDYVTFLGYREDVSKLLGIADIFVLSSHSEGLSCSIMEAHMHGLPVVATDVGGNGELILNGKTGILVTPDAADEFALAVSDLAFDEQKRTQFSNAAQRRAEKQFSLGRMTAEYQNLYKRRYSR